VKAYDENSNDVPKKHKLRERTENRNTAKDKIGKGAEKKKRFFNWIQYQLELFSNQFESLLKP
jgi:hypothetical protein